MCRLLYIKYRGCKHRVTMMICTPSNDCNINPIPNVRCPNARSNRRWCPSCYTARYPNHTKQLPILRTPPEIPDLFVTPLEPHVYQHSADIPQWRREREHHITGLKLHAAPTLGQQMLANTMRLEGARVRSIERWLEIPQRYADSRVYYPGGSHHGLRYNFERNYWYGPRGDFEGEFQGHVYPGSSEDVGYGDGDGDGDGEGDGDGDGDGEGDGRNGDNDSVGYSDSSGDSDDDSDDSDSGSDCDGLISRDQGAAGPSSEDIGILFRLLAALESGWASAPANPEEEEEEEEEEEDNGW